MRILQINSVYSRGSTGRIAEGISRVARERGHEVLTAYGRGRIVGDGSSWRFARTSSLAAHLLASRFDDRQGFHSNSDTRALLARMDEYRPDLVHLHNAHGYYLNLPMLLDYIAARGTGLVVTMHDCWLFTGHCAQFDAVGCDRWMTGCGRCPQKREYPASLCVDASARNYLEKKKCLDAVRGMILVTPSAWLASLVRRSFLSGMRVETIPNGIDLDLFRPLCNGGKPDGYPVGKRVVLGAAMPWTWKKGIEGFFELRRRIPSDVEIVLIGMNRSQANRLPMGIIGVPPTSSASEMASWYRAADVFVNCSLEETLPTTNIEALACGTPVVTSDAGGAPETVDSSTGRVFGKGEWNGLGDAVVEVLARGKKTFTEACVGRAVNLFDMKARFAEYVDLYESISTKG
jgi:glycosyltransferase involved in cell wall biosynthesis